MAMELYVPARGGPGTSHGIVGALTKTTINNIVVRIGDIVEFVHQDKRVSGSPIWYYVAVPTIIMVILLVIHFIRKEIKYRQFCKDFWD